MGLREWAERALRVVEQDGTCAKLVRLSSEGTPWETWHAPFPDVEQFIIEAHAVQEAIKAECPIRRVPLMFTAEGAAGNVLSQYPTSVQGTNKQADALAGSGNNAAKAFAEAMESITRVMVAVTKSQESHVVSLTKTLESQAEQIHDLIEYHKAKQELELTEQRETSDASSMLMAQVKEVLPMIPHALELFLKDKQNSQAAEALATVAKTAKNVTKPLSNGAKS